MEMYIWSIKDNGINFSKLCHSMQLKRKEKMCLTKFMHSVKQDCAHVNVFMNNDFICICELINGMRTVKKRGVRKRINCTS